MDQNAIKCWPCLQNFFVPFDLLFHLIFCSIWSWKFIKTPSSRGLGCHWTNLEKPQESSKMSAAAAFLGSHELQDGSLDCIGHVPSCPHTSDHTNHCPTSKQVACSLLRCYVHHIFGMGQIMIMKVTWIAPGLPKILWSWFSFASNPRTDLRSPQSSNTVTIKEESADGYIGKIRWLWLPMICAGGQIGWQHWAGAGWGGNMGEVTWSRGNMGKGSPTQG